MLFRSVGIGAGMIYATTYFPVLAPLPVSHNAYALAFFSFCRALAGVSHSHLSRQMRSRNLVLQAWGISIATAILQTQLSHRLPQEFLDQFPGGLSFAYSIIPMIKTLPEPTKTVVQHAFADSILVIWQVMIGLSGLGLIVSLAMKGLPLHTEMDKRWGIEHGQAEKDFEQQSSQVSDC